MDAVSLSPQNQSNTSMASGGLPRYDVFLLDQSGVPAWPPVLVQSGVADYR
jgi:hypothetical protein